MGIDQKVNYEIKKDNSGIELKSFELDGLEMKVENLLYYTPWNFGVYHPGSGQIGIYKLKDSNNRESVALIKDYRAMEGDWRIYLVESAKNEKILMSKMMIGDNFEEYFVFLLPYLKKMYP